MALFGSDKDVKIVVRMIDETQASLRQIQGGMDKLQNSTNANSLSFEKLTGATFIANGALKVLEAGANMVHNSFDDMFNVLKSGAEFEQLKVATVTMANNMGVSTEEVNKMVKSLEDVNTFGSNAYKAVQAMTQNGLLPYMDALKRVDKTSGTTLQGFDAFIMGVKDLGASFMVNSDQAIDSFTKFVTSGRSELVEMYGMNRSLINIYEEYAKSLNKGASDLSETEKAQARLNYVMSESDKYTGVYAKTYETAGKNLLSIESATRALTEQLGSEFQPAFKTVTAFVLQALKDMRKATESETFKTFTKLINDGFIAIFETLKPLQNIFINFVSNKDVQQFFQNMLVTVQGLTQWLVQLIVNGFEWLSRTFQALAPDLNEIWNDLSGIFNVVATVLGDGDLQAMDTQLKQTFTEGLKNIVHEISIKIKEFYEWVKSPEGQQALETLKNMIAGAYQVFTDLVAFFTNPDTINAFLTVIDYVKRLINPFYNLQRQIEDAQKAWNDFWGIQQSKPMETITLSNGKVIPAQSVDPTKVQQTKDKIQADINANKQLTLDKLSLPQYDIGTPLLKHDTIAQVHKGEMIVPANMNPNNPNASNPMGGLTINVNAPVYGVDNLTATIAKAIEEAQANSNKLARYNLNG